MPKRATRRHGQDRSHGFGPNSAVVSSDGGITGNAMTRAEALAILAGGDFDQFIGYRWLTRGGVVDEGTTRGKKMHGARYTLGTEFYLRDRVLPPLRDRVLPRHRRHLRDGAASSATPMSARPRTSTSRAPRPTSRTSSARSGANDLRTNIPIDAGPHELSLANSSFAGTMEAAGIEPASAVAPTERLRA